MILAIILAVAGLILIYLEFFLPGAIMGIAGGLSLVASVVVFLFAEPHPVALVSFIIAILILLLIDIKLALHFVRRTGKKGTVFLDSDQEGYQASAFHKHLVGKKGTALSDLKPSGHIRVEGKYLQATSKTGYIDKGASVEIVSGEGAHLIVKEIKEET